MQFVPPSFLRALLEAAGETDAAFAEYCDHVTGVAAQFDALPPEDWGILTPQIAHVHTVGDELVRQWKASEGKEASDVDASRTLAFAWNITRYLAMRREVHNRAWLEIGLEASRSLNEQRAELLFMNEIGLAWSALGEKRKALDSTSTSRRSPSAAPSATALARL